MGKRGPKPAGTGKFAKKGATLGARITADTRKRLDAAARRSGRSLSAEVEARLARTLGADGETEHHLLQLVRECMRRTDGFTGQSWIADPYTFDLMLAATVVMLHKFRPVGEARLPETIQWLRGFADAPPQLRQQHRAMIENEPPTVFAHTIAGGVIIDLEQHGIQVPDDQRALYEDAAEYLKELLTDPVLQTTSKEGP